MEAKRKEKIPATQKYKTRN